jgi:hypothetical protein
MNPDAHFGTDGSARSAPAAAQRDLLKLRVRSTEETRPPPRAQTRKKDHVCTRIVGESRHFLQDASAAQRHEARRHAGGNSPMRRFPQMCAGGGFPALVGPLPQQE